MLNYGPELDREMPGAMNKKEEEQKEMSKLKSAAQDPLLRRLVTMHSGDRHLARSLSV